MNTQTQAMPTTPYLLDADWIEAIRVELARQTTDAPFPIEPCVMSVYDLMFGRECDPTNYYRTVAECEAYLICYMDGAKAWAAKVDEVNATAASGYTDLEYAEMTDEYVSWMQDVTWMQGGMS